MTIWAHDKKIPWVVAEVGIEVMHLKVRPPAALFEGKRAKLAFATMQFA